MLAGSFRNFRVKMGSLVGTADTCYEHKNEDAIEYMELMCTQPIVAQFVRLEVDGTNIRVCEIGVYGGKRNAEEFEIL